MSSEPKPQTTAEAEAEADVKVAVTTAMRQAAINYWYSLHPETGAVPIGEINGIIYAALGASQLIQALQDVRRAIMTADPAILTDTLWVSEIETAVDRIDAALNPEECA